MRPIFQVLIVFFSIVLFILTYYLNHKIKMPSNAEFEKCRNCNNSACKNRNKINDCEEYINEK